MARTPEQIALELADSIESTDGTLDTVQGPIPDIMIRPQAGQLAIASEEAESLRRLFTLEFQDAATDDEVKNALANYGSAPGVGENARHVQYFMRFTKPTTDLEVPAGTLVSNLEGSLLYRVINTGKILASSPASFFNPSRNAYEIGLLVEAVGTGPDFNLPSFRVNTLITPVVGIDSTENRVASTGGVDAETKEEQSARLKNSLKGINLGSTGGIVSRIGNTLPELVSDVAVIQPFEKEFSRILAGPALDVLCIGQVLESFQESFEAIGGETQLVLGKTPAVSIVSLTVNGVSGVVGFTLVNDTTHETGNSLMATDIVVLDTVLTIGDEVIITYLYNSLLETVLSDVFNGGEGLLFNTDILLRSPLKANPRIIGTVKALPSFNITEVEQGVASFLSTFFNFTKFASIVYPEVIRQRVITEVSGVHDFKMTTFRRQSGSLADVEPMVFARNEVSVYDTQYVSIKVVR